MKPLSFLEVKQSSEKQALDKKRESRAFWLPLQKYWILYAFLFLTAVLSLFAGLYIGLSPNPDGTILFASNWDVIRRVFFALYFSVGFVLTAEGATLFWETKLVYHDVDQQGKQNDTQVNTARAALIVSVLTVVLTGLSAAHFIAQWTGTLSNFAAIPDAAQKWVVWSIPILLVYHAASAMLYWYNSAEAALSRYKSAIVLQTQAQMSEIESAAFIDEYQRVAPELAKLRGKQLAKQQAQLDFYQREKELGKDLDGDGHIGAPMPRNVPLPVMGSEVKREELPSKDFT